MNKFIYRFLLITLVSIVSLSSVTAQNKPAKGKTKAAAGFDVRLPVSVISKRKQFVTGLTPSDFVVIENGRRQKVTLFSDRKNNPPPYVGILMGTSPSMQAKMGFIKAAVRDLAYSITRLRKGKAAFLTFDNEIKFWQDFTGNIDILERAIDRVKETGEQNSLYDAVYQFCDEKMRNVGGQRAMIVITDGQDTFSRSKLKDVIDIAQRTETVIYIVSTDAGTDRKTNEILLELAKETGGATFFVSDMLNLETAFFRILKETESQYLLTYRPKNQKYDGKERKIEVRFADRKKNRDYEIRTKTKYRAVKERVK